MVLSRRVVQTEGHWRRGRGGRGEGEEGGEIEKVGKNVGMCVLERERKNNQVKGCLY